MILSNDKKPEYCDVCGKLTRNWIPLVVDDSDFEYTVCPTCRIEHEQEEQDRLAWERVINGIDESQL